jgi:hypothetical protein
VPVLFHSGYLTIDQIKTEPSDQDSYSFKLPNTEVSLDYYQNCAEIISEIEFFYKDFQNKKKELYAAFLEGKALTVSSIFRDIFSNISYFNRPEDEKNFRGSVHFILSAMGFTIFNEIPGFTGKLDLCLLLEDHVFVIIEVKYCPDKKKLTPTEENRVLAVKSQIIIPSEVRDKYLANAVE